MEKPQLERREKIAAAIVLASLGGAALHARREGKLFHARHYPGGSVIIDVLKETKERSIRIGIALQNLTPLKFEIDPAEHSDSDLDEVEELSQIAIAEKKNPLQTG